MEEWGGRTFDRSTHLAILSLVSGPVNGSNQRHTSRSKPSRHSVSSIPSKATRSSSVYAPTQRRPRTEVHARPKVLESIKGAKVNDWFLRLSPGYPLGRDGDICCFRRTRSL